MYDNSIQSGPQSSSPLPPVASPQVIYPPHQTAPEAYHNDSNAPNIIYSSIPLFQDKPAIVILAKNIEVPIFGNMPVLVMCKHCNSTVTTRTESSIGCMVWLMFGIFYLISPCISCVPFCINEWYDKVHFCPKCSRILGRFSLV